MRVGLKQATHSWGYYALALVMGAVFIGGMGATWYSIILNATLILALMLMSLNDGAYNGEKACTLAVSLEKQVKEGRRVDERLKSQVYDRKIAAWILIFGSLPFLLVSTVNAVVAPFYPEVVVESEEAEDPVGSFAFDYSDEEDLAEEAPINVVNVVARIVFMPFITVYSMVSGSVLNGLFFLFSVLMPGAQAIGYLLGPKMRGKKLIEIARGKKRKQRNLKVHKKPRQPKAEV